MIIINFLNIENSLFINYKKLINNVPEFMQREIYSYNLDKDQKRYLFGKLVLRKLLVEFGYPKEILQDFKTDTNNRPFLNDHIDFNISHAGDYVICAVSTNSKVGIDIEEIKNIDIDEIKDKVFNDDENKRMGKEPVSKEVFYAIWTLKEAALKANGKGFLISMKDIEIYDKDLICSNELWQYNKLEIANGYSCHVVHKGNTTIVTNEINTLSSLLF